MILPLAILVALCPAVEARKRSQCADLKPEQRLSAQQQSVVDAAVSAGVAGLGSGAAQALTASSSEATFQLLNEDTLARSWFVYQTCVLRDTGMIDQPTAERLVSHIMGIPAAPVPSTPAAAATVGSAGGGLRWTYYNLPPWEGDGSPTPRAAPAAQLTGDPLSRDLCGDSPAPGVTADWFLARAEGEIYVDAAGTTSIVLGTTQGTGWGGAMVRIGENEATTRGGTRPYPMYFAASGWYPMQLDVWHREGHFYWSFEWQPPGAAGPRSVPEAVLRPPPEPAGTTSEPEGGGVKQGADPSTLPPLPPPPPALRPSSLPRPSPGLPDRRCPPPRHRALPRRASLARTPSSRPARATTSCSPSPRRGAGT